MIKKKASMKGFELTVNEKKIKGAIKEGSTCVILTHRDNEYNIYFGSLDNAGMLSYIWYSSKPEDDAKFTISVEDIGETSEPAVIMDYSNKEQLNKLSLEYYYKLRDELAKEEGNQIRGFIVRYKNEEIKIAAKDGLAMIDVFENKGERRLSIGLFDYADSTRSIYDPISLDMGDKFEVELAEIEESSQPVKVIKDNTIKCVTKSKPEVFMELENNLKKRGLL